MNKKIQKSYGRFEHIKTGTKYLWVDLSTKDTGYVYVCTPAQSIYIVRFENLRRIPR